MNLIKICFSLGLAIMLSACGGGSGSDSGSDSDSSSGTSNTVTNTFSLSASSSTITINEEGSAEFSIDYSDNSGDVVLSVSADEADVVDINDYQLSTDSTDKTVSFSVGELNQDQVVNITVTATDSAGDTTTLGLTVNAINTSLIAKITELTVIQDKADTIYTLSEESELLDVLTTLALLSGDLSSEESAAYITSLDNAFDSSIQAELTSLLNAFDTSDTAMTFPTEFSETDVDAALVTLYEGFSEYVNEVNNIIENVQIDMGTSIVGEIPLGDFYYNASASSFSQIYGNPELGVWDTSNAFDDEYAFLEKITFPDSYVCN